MEVIKIIIGLLIILMLLFTIGWLRNENEIQQSNISFMPKEKEEEEK